MRYRTDQIQFLRYDFIQAMGDSFHALVMTIGSELNNYQEKLMNKDQIEGLVEEVKGKVKEAAGVILDDKGMEIEGNVQKNVGKVQSGFGDLKEDIKKEIEDD